MREGAGVSRVRMLSKRDENLVASHVPPKGEARSHNSTRSGSKKGCFERKARRVLLCLLLDFVPVFPLISWVTLRKRQLLTLPFSSPSPRPSPQEKGAKGRRWQISSAPRAEDVWLLWALLGPLGSNSLPSGKADPKP